jgi:FkbM family methyltransferase
MSKRRAPRGTAEPEAPRRGRQQSATADKLRVRTAETMNSGRTNADGTPIHTLDDAQLRSETIAAMRQRIEALTLKLGPGAASPSSAGLNAAYADDLRAARIFALQLNMVGITRLLDIGSSDGRFGRQLRRFGYGGLIYSVEPRWPRYLQLLLAASTDPQWVPLPRQAASDLDGHIDLPLVNDDRPGFQSPMGIPAPAEHIHSVRALDLLNPSAMNQVQALRINANGMERRILEGLGPILNNLSVVMLDGTAVANGSGGFFSIDAALANSWGFARAAIEPASYDDDAGTVRQYHGIYVRPRSRQDVQSNGITVGGVVTSIGGPIERLRGDGTDVGQWWADICVNSWLSLGGRTLSVSETPSPSEAVGWSVCASKPSISELFRRMADIDGAHLILTNADICLTGAMKEALGGLAQGVLYYGNRHEVQLRGSGFKELFSSGYFSGGFDYFILPREFIEAVNEDGLIPDAFLVGEPWWDYLIPVVALAAGFPCKKLPAATMSALHYSHSTRAERDLWRSNGALFEEYIRKLHQSEFPHGKELLAHILRQPKADLDDRLSHMSQIVCYALP